MFAVAPRLVNDVSYVRGYYHESNFLWQAQYLVQLEGDSCLLCALEMIDTDQS